MEVILVDISIYPTVEHDKKKYLMHSSGYESQSIIQRYRCHDIQPIGGVNAKPLFNAFTENIF